MAQLDKELLDRINELSKKEKTEGLTAEEKIEQKQAREQYRVKFREAFRGILNNTKVVDPKGKDVTPAKAKKLQSRYKKN